MPLTRVQLEENINALENQGAKKDEIQQYLNTLKLDKASGSYLRPGESSSPAATPKSFKEKLMNTGTDVANFFGFKGVTEQFGADIARSQVDTAQEKNMVQYPSMKEVAGSAVQGAANFVPGAGRGASMAVKALVGAGTGLAVETGAELQEGKTFAEAITPGATTAISAVLPIVGNLLGKTTQNATKKIAENMEKSNLRLSPKDKVYVEKQGPEFMDWLTSKKLTGNPEQRFQKIDELYNSMEDKVQAVISKSKETIAKKDFVQILNEIPEQLSDDPELYTEAKRIVSLITKTAQEKFPDELPLVLINKLKRSNAKRAFDKAGQAVTNESRYRVAEVLKEVLDAKLPELSPLNDEYSKIILSRKLISKAVGRKQIGLVGKIGATVAGGAIGTSIGGPVGTAVGAVMGERVAENLVGMKTRSITGAVAQRLYEKVSKAPTSKKSFTVSKKLLLNLLESLQ